MFCKTIILSNSSNSTSNAPKGILTLAKESTYITGKIRLYNLISIPASTKIGLYINDRVHISALAKKPSHYEFSINENLDITQSIYCALIDTSSVDKKVLLEGGSFNGFYFTDSPFDAILESKDEELERTIDSALQQSEECENCNCANCEYKKYFYTHHSKSSVDIPENQTTQPSTDNSNKPQEDFSIETFQQGVINNLENDLNNHISNMAYDAMQESNSTTLNEQDNVNETKNEKSSQSEFLNDIIYQLDEMFAKYPEDDVLKSIIPSSRFVRVDANPPYVLGIIYEDGAMKYIAYGVPATYNSLPPSDLGQHYQWLPLNPNDVMSDGYFMIFQDALNGTLIEINFEQ